MSPITATRVDRMLRLRTGIRRAPGVLCVALAATLLAATPAAAALYKWTDANGRVIYSDQPPTGNVKVESINAPPPPADPNAVKDLANKELELQKKKMVRADDDAKANKARVDANMKRQECERARGQALALTQSSQIVIYTTNAKGERMAMDDAARFAERQRLDYWINQNCQNLPPN